MTSPEQGLPRRWTALSRLQRARWIERHPEISERRERIGRIARGDTLPGPVDDDADWEASDDDIVSVYLSGIKPSGIPADLGVDLARVKRVIGRYRKSHPGASNEHRKNAPVRWMTIDAESVMVRREAGRSLEAIAKDLHISRRTLRRVMDEGRTGCG